MRSDKVARRLDEGRMRLRSELREQEYADVKDLEPIVSASARAWSACASWCLALIIWVVQEKLIGARGRPTSICGERWLTVYGPPQAHLQRTRSSLQFSGANV